MDATSTAYSETFPTSIKIISGGCRHAFVPEEHSADVAVFDLGGLLSGRAARRRDLGRVTGLIPVADAPSGIALSPGGSRVHVVSQGDSTAPATPQTIAVIDTGRARPDSLGSGGSSAPRPDKQDPWPNWDLRPY